jgi:hypothetical protein
VAGLAVGERSDDPGLAVRERSVAGLAVRERSVAGLAVGERSDDPGLAVREPLIPGRSEVRSPLRPPAGRAGASSQDRRPVPEGARRSRPWSGRVLGPRSKPALPGPSSVRRGPSPRKVPVPGPLLRAPAPNGRPPFRLVPSVPGRPEVRRAPSPNDRPAAGRDPSRAAGRAVRRAPSAAAGRALPSGASGRAGRRALSLVTGRDARQVPSPRRAVVSPRARSGDDVRVVRRGPLAAGARGARRALSSAAALSRPVASRSVLSRPAPSRAVLSRPVVSWPAPSRPVPRRSPPPRSVRGSCPARVADVRPRPYAVVPLVPVGRGRLGLFAVPDVVRAVFGMPRPPPVRPPPAPRPLGVSRPSATPTNLQHPYHSTQTNEEGRSTTSGATLFKHVRRRPTLPRGPPRSTIGAEGLNFRVRNGTGCFPFAITAETLLRCHRPRGA